MDPEVVATSVDQPNRAVIPGEVGEDVEAADRFPHIGNHLGGDPTSLDFLGHTARQHPVENPTAETFAAVPSPGERPMSECERHPEPPPGNAGRPGNDQTGDLLAMVCRRGHTHVSTERMPHDDSVTSHVVDGAAHRVDRALEAEALTTSRTVAWKVDGAHRVPDSDSVENIDPAPATEADAVQEDHR